MTDQAFAQAHPQPSAPDAGHSSTYLIRLDADEFQILMAMRTATQRAMSRGAARKHQELLSFAGDVFSSLDTLLGDREEVESEH